MASIASKISLGLAGLIALYADPAHAAAPVPNPGNNAWMMTATVLVLLMILPGLALFYGGLTRSKNMLSMMTQIGASAALAMIVWVMWGYSLAFGDTTYEGTLGLFVSGGSYFLSAEWMRAARQRHLRTKSSANTSLSASR